MKEGRRGGAGLPRLHVVTDARVLERAGWLEQALAVLEAGGRWLALHVRGPGLSGRRVYDRVRELLGPARRAGAQLVVNDRVDVALLLPLWGVQLGVRSLPVQDARWLLGEGVCIGASVHDPAEARDAQEQGADYLVVGTVFATPTHPGRAGGGPELVREVLATCRLPLLAIGGITPERVGAVRQAGAQGVAVLSGVWDAPDPAAAVPIYLRALR